MKRNILVILSILLSSALLGQEPGSEARALYESALEAVGRASTREELRAAGTGILSALSASPDWAEPYYAFGRLQELLEVFDQALAYYERYLELNPEAPDREEVQGRIRDCRQRQARLEKNRKMLAKGRWREVMHLPPVRFNPPIVSTRFRISRDGRIEAQHPYMHQVKNPLKGSVREEWSPVEFDGRYFEYSFKIYYESLDPPRTDFCLQTVIGEIFSGNPLRVRQTLYRRCASPIFVPITEETLVGEVFYELR